MCSNRPDKYGASIPIRSRRQPIQYNITFHYRHSSVIERLMCGTEQSQIHRIQIRFGRAIETKPPDRAFSAISSHFRAHQRHNLQLLKQRAESVAFVSKDRFTKGSIPFEQGRGKTVAAHHRVYGEAWRQDDHKIGPSICWPLRSRGETTEHEVQDAPVLDVADGCWRPDLCGDRDLDSRAVGSLGDDCELVVHAQTVVEPLDRDVLGPVETKRVQ